MLSPRRLTEVMADLAAIDHVRIVRIHTRVPVADPERITGELISALKVTGATTWVALHANHVRELTGKARAACADIVDAGIPMVSQSVLLRGVNDDAATLEALMRGFVECRIKPYYLHHGDLAPGTSHLRTTLEHGQELMRGLRGRVSGLCQPDYVIDIPGGYGKAPVGPNYLSPAASSSHVNSFAGEGEEQAETRYRVTDYCGDVHLYPPKSYPPKSY
jgi:lysine 2,3-aminomutase